MLRSGRWKYCRLSSRAVGKSTKELDATERDGLAELLYDFIFAVGEDDGGSRLGQFGSLLNAGLATNTARLGEATPRTTRREASR